MALAYLCFLAVLCSFLQQGLALQCYECNSIDNPACAEDPLPASIEAKECNATNPVCRIMWLEVTKVAPYTSRLVRSCGEKDNNDAMKPCYRISESSHQKVCMCESDRCNSSNAPVAATALMLFTLFILWL